jgi:DNA-binding MarR family transcriptional regulator
MEVKQMAGDERENSVGFLVRKLGNVMKKRKERREAGAGEPLTMMQCWVLGYLTHSNDHDVYQRELESNLNIGKSTLTEVLHLMEKNDLVRREPVEEDKRLKRIVLTEKSRQINEAIAEDIRVTEKKLREGIPEEDLEVFTRTIKKMISNLEDE